jgi:hypothetical protein
MNRINVMLNSFVEFLSGALAWALAGAASKFKGVQTLSSLDA